MTTTTTTTTVCHHEWIEIGKRPRETNKKHVRRIVQPLPLYPRWFVVSCMIGLSQLAVTHGGGGGTSGTVTPERDVPCWSPSLDMRGGYQMDDNDDDNHHQARQNALLDAYIDALLAGEETDTIATTTTTSEEEDTRVRSSNNNNSADLAHTTVTFVEQPQQPPKHRPIGTHTRRHCSTSPFHPSSRVGRGGHEEEEEGDESERLGKVSSKIKTTKSTKRKQKPHDTQNNTTNTTTTDDDTLPIHGRQDTTASNTSEAFVEPNMDDDNPPPTPSTATTAAAASVPPTIPNPLFRFLLHRGRIGHVLIMTLAIWLDWLALYIPLVSHVLDWFYVHLLPRSVREPAHFRNQGGRHSSQTPVTMATTASTTLARTGASRSKRRQLVRQADERALHQLQALDSNAIYQQVSSAFMQRHGLGRYRRRQPQQQNLADAATSSTKALREDSSQGESSRSPLTAAVSSRGTASNRSNAKKKKKTTTSKKDIPKKKDWVVEALTKDRKGGIVRPKSSLELGTKSGLSVGLDFGTDTRDRYRASVVHVIASEQALPKHARRPGDSNTVVTSDNASGLMGKLRAAAGSSVSRSLLGAYPGDALPVQEAADTHGLMGLAQRYGYSDLFHLDQDDDDHDQNGHGARNHWDDTTFATVEEEPPSFPTKTFARRKGSAADQLLTGRRTGRRVERDRHSSTTRRHVPRNSLIDQSSREPSERLAGSSTLSKSVPRRKGSLADTILSGSDRYRSSSALSSRRTSGGTNKKSSRKDETTESS